MSYVTFFFFFFGQSGEAYWWRVCYQWGLPRLVCLDGEVFFIKGLESQYVKGLAVAGFNHARTITNASAKGLDTRQDAYNLPWELSYNPVR